MSKAESKCPMARAVIIEPTWKTKLGAQLATSWIVSTWTSTKMCKLASWLADKLWSKLTSWLTNWQAARLTRWQKDKVTEWQFDMMTKVGKSWQSANTSHADGSERDFVCYEHPLCCTSKSFQPALEEKLWRLNSHSRTIRNSLNLTIIVSNRPLLLHHKISLSCFSR